MTTATRTPTERESANQTQRSLPALDMARVQPGLETLGKPLADLIAKRKEMMAEARHARIAAERAEHAVHLAREKDTQAFSEAALEGGEDPGPVHETEAVAAAEEAHRLAVGLTHAHNETVKRIRSAINGEDGDKALAKVAKDTDVARDRMRKSLEAALADLTVLQGNQALADAIEDTRKSTYTTLKTAVPKAVQVHASGREADARAVLQALVSLYLEDGES